MTENNIKYVKRILISVILADFLKEAVASYQKFALSNYSDESIDTKFAVGYPERILSAMDQVDNAALLEELGGS